MLVEMPMFHVKHGGATRRILSISGMVSRETSIPTTASRGGETHSKPSPTHYVSRETQKKTSSNEAHSVARKCGSASHGINTHNNFLEVSKSRLDDTFFLIPAYWYR